MLFRIGSPLFPRFLSLFVPTLSELILAQGPSTSACSIFFIAKKSSDILILAECHRLRPSKLIQSGEQITPTSRTVVEEEGSR